MSALQINPFMLNPLAPSPLPSPLRMPALPVAPVMPMYPERGYPERRPPEYERRSESPKGNPIAAADMDARAAARAAEIAGSITELERREEAAALALHVLEDELQALRIEERATVAERAEVMSRHRALEDAHASALAKLRSVAPTDAIDERIRLYMDRTPGFALPIKKQGPGEYLVGVKRIVVEPRGEKLVVRIGGGFNTLREFLDQYWKAEAVQAETHYRIEAAKAPRSDVSRQTSTCSLNGFRGPPSSRATRD
jgi:hypothetical protein